MDDTYGIPWTLDDDNRASDEGWGLFLSNQHGLEIERDDEAGVFDDDTEAYIHVALAALRGSELHQRALAIATLQQLAQQPGSATWRCFP